jgi:hypothetical protein
MDISQGDPSPGAFGILSRFHDRHRQHPIFACRVAALTENGSPVRRRTVGTLTGSRLASQARWSPCQP